MRKEKRKNPGLPIEMVAGTTRSRSERPLAWKPSKEWAVRLSGSKKVKDDERDKAVMNSW